MWLNPVAADGEGVPASMRRVGSSRQNLDVPTCDTRRVLPDIPGAARRANRLTLILILDTILLLLRLLLNAQTNKLTVAGPCY